MKSYKNHFLDIAIFPDKNWKIISYQTSKIKVSETHLYQNKDNELPIYDGQLKRLFSLQLHQDSNKKIINCEIELSILKTEKQDFPLDCELTGTGKTFYGELKKDSENDSEWYFLVSPFQLDYWFYLKIVINRTVMRETAMAAFRSIIFNSSKTAVFLGERFENAMASAYGYPLFLALPNIKPMEIHQNCHESYIFDKAKHKIYFQIWSRKLTGNLQTILAIFDIINKQLTIFERSFSGLILLKIENELLFAIETLFENLNQICIDLKTEKSNFKIK